MPKRVNYDTGNGTSTSTGLYFPILELPVNLIYEVLSSLPLNTVFSCKCVSKTFLNLLEDPYFANLHLVKSSTTNANLIFQERSNRRELASMSMLDLNETRSTSPCSTDHSLGPGPGYGAGCCPPLRKPNLKFCYLNDRMDVVGSCNGLLCLYKTAPRRPLYCIINPIIGEYTVLPRPTPPNPFYLYLQDTGFGFCPKSKQYKIIRLMLSYDLSLTSKKTVAEVHTLGTKSWRKIEDVPSPKNRVGFDPFLNGSLYWVTDSQRSSDLICSFDLETEKFKPVPPPSRFEDSGYLSKISMIEFGSLRGCLCLCYVFEGLQFSVWVMKENGSDKCWSNVFSIDFEFYCGLSALDFHQPIKFVEHENGVELLLLCNLVSLFLYNPEKKTFRDLGMVDLAKRDVIAYTPSFISLKDAAVVGKNLKVKKFKLGQQLSALSLDLSPAEDRDASPLAKLIGEKDELGIENETSTTIGLHFAVL